MKTTVRAWLDKREITVHNDQLQEVLNYVDCEDADTKDDILSLLDYDKLDYSGACHEAIDGAIDIYYNDLAKWVGIDGNHSYVEQAIDDGLSDGSDFYKSIQAGQYVKLCEEFQTELDSVISQVSDLDDEEEEEEGEEV